MPPTDATDTTMVASGPRIPYAQNQTEVTVTDHRDYAMPGDIIEYVVTVKNTTDSAIVIPVKFTLSPVTGVLSASPQAERFGRDLWWRDVSFSAGQSRAFIVKALLDPRVMSHYPIQVVALAGFDVGVDRTVVGPIFGRYALNASITDSRETVARGELVHYKIRIKNQSARIITDLAVNAALPVHSEFAGAGEGGWWDGDTVRWQELQIAPGGSRELLFTIRVRGDAQDGEALKASAYVDGSIVNDVTVVSGGTYSPAVFAPYLKSAKSAKSHAFFRSGSPFVYLS
ncbi:MAG: hypothetical protein Q7R41_04650, partial [Phycisphaerales bacterium]|nr:hypothetical protein [Phycisphaerales bacterium]